MDTIIVPGTGAPGDTVIIETYLKKTASENGKPHVSIRISRQAGTGHLVTGIRAAGSGPLDAWETNQNGFVDLDMSGFQKGNNDFLAGEIGGTSKSIISAGAYVSKVQILKFNGMPSTLGPDTVGGL